MSATDVGWAPPGGDKDNKEENDALAWKGVAIATLLWHVIDTRER